jgi:hypothetical protein
MNGAFGLRRTISTSGGSAARAPLRQIKALAAIGSVAELAGFIVREYAASRAGKSGNIRRAAGSNRMNPPETTVCEPHFQRTFS